MDITLLPGKLHGKLQARPSRECAALHAICQQLACLQSREASCSHDFLRDPLLWSAHLEAATQMLRSLPSDAPQLNSQSSPEALYLLLPIAAACKHKASFVGTQALADLRITPLTDVLHRRGSRFSRGELKLKRRDRDQYREICTLHGRMEHGDFSLSGREHPYFIAGLLFALPLLAGSSSVRMTTMPDAAGLLQTTAEIIRCYGIRIHTSVDDYGYPVYEIPGNQCYHIPPHVSIEGDWTKAAFWLGCGALGGDVTVQGLAEGSHQSARQILDKLQTLGADTGMTRDSAAVISGHLQGCNINAARISRLVPILSVVMANARGSSMLTGIDAKAHQPVFETLDQLAADITSGGSGFSFTGRAILPGGELHAEGNPIVVMVATAASCICRQAVTIRDAGAVNKRYPGFFEDFEALGGQISR